MSGVSPISGGFRISLVLSQPFFLITTLLHVIAWPLTFIAQSLAEGRYHTLRSSDSSKPTGTPIGLGWFAIFYQLFIFCRIVGSVMQESEFQVREQLATLVAINVVLGVLCSNSAIYAQHNIALTLYGYGWMVLAGLNLLWLVYFTSSERSSIMSLLNPSFQRKQLIRTSINLRQSGSYSSPNLPMIASGYPGHYAGAHEIMLEGGRGADAGPNPDNEKFLNDVTSALLPSDYPHMSDGYNAPNNHRMSSNHQQENHMVSNINPAPQLQVPSQNNPSGLQFQQDHQPKPLNPQYDPIHHNSAYYYQENQDQPWQQQRMNQHISRVDPPSNNFQQTLPPQHHPDPVESGSALVPSTSSAQTGNFQPLTILDRTLLNQAYRQEELRSATNSEIPNSPIISKAEEPSMRAKALYAYKASATDPNELSFEKGETLEILNHTGKWWQAKRATGESGIVPSNYFQMLSQ